MEELMRSTRYETIDEVISSCTASLAQVESLQGWCVSRTEKLEGAKNETLRVYGDDVGKLVAVSCAIGCEGDLSHALRQAGQALRQEIEHLQSLSSPG